MVPQVLDTMSNYLGYFFTTIQKNPILILEH